MVVENFSRGSSWIHQLDSRIKLIFTTIFSLLIAGSSNPLMLFQVYILSIILLLSARLNLKVVFKRLMIINLFIMFVWIFIPFTYPGQIIYKLGPLTASEPGIIYAFKITLRTNTIMLFIITLLATSSISSTIQAMKYFYIPDKLIYLFFFVYRYLHVMKKEFKKLYNSMLIRGFKPKTNIHTYKSYAYLIGMLLLRSYERAQKVYEAMLCRGFKGEFYILDRQSLDKNDIIFSTASIIIVLWLIIVEKGWLVI
ncbi:MAG: cobalt ECF transporter T component CbiQ [Bacillota bacterium]